MNSLHSGLQNKDTYYLNQFYLRISYSDKSYKKHPNTKLQQTAFLWVSYRQRNFHPRHTELAVLSAAAATAKLTTSSMFSSQPPPAAIHVTTLTDH